MRSSILGLLLVRIVLGLSAASLSGCGKENPTFSLLAESNVFNQGIAVETKVDVLFVIDNSGSMQPAQTNLTNNFSAFITQFVSKGYDFHIGVIPSDAYKATFPNSGYNAGYIRLKDGYGNNPANHSGVFVIKPTTPNIESTFMINATQGIFGAGDERPFQSFKSALLSPLNSDFRRPDAFLAIIIISDEDDFSWNGNSDNNENYNDPNLHSIQSYVDFLDDFTGSSETLKRYSVSSIHVLDNACLAASHFAANIGIRYSQLVDATGGVKGSICSPSFATELDLIQKGILKLATQFYLPREPDPATIQVLVNNVDVPNDPVNGYTYDPVANSIIFNGTSIPAQGSTIVVNYDPVTIL